MFSTDSFSQYAYWGVIATIVFGVLAALSFFLKWGMRYRLVGVTGFTGVLTFGLFALSLTPLTRISVPNAQHYSLVFDDGANQTVIAVAQDITPEQVSATLEQATSDLFSAGRLGRENRRLYVRARTMIHPKDGLSEPLLLGQASRSLLSRDDADLDIQLFPKNFKRLPPRLNRLERHILSAKKVENLHIIKTEGLMVFSIQIY